MKLTYWLAKCLDDHSCYSVRSKTKKGAQEERATLVEARGEASYGPVEKIEVEYKDGFDLVYHALGEGGFEG